MSWTCYFFQNLGSGPHCNFASDGDLVFPLEVDILADRPNILVTYAMQKEEVRSLLQTDVNISISEID